MKTERIKKWVLRSFTLVVILIAVAILLASILFYSWRSNLADNEHTTKSIVNINNGFVEYYFEQRGDETIFYSHATPDNFLKSGQRISAAFDYSLLAPARPGYFDTMIATGKSPAEQADLYAALLDNFGIDKVVMWGVSGGGPAAVEFAKKYPEKCDGLILQASYLTRSDFRSRMAVFDDSFESEVGYWLKLNWDRYWVNNDVTKANMKSYLESIIPFSLIRNGLLNDRSQLAKLELFGLEEIECPVLIVHGSRDEYSSFSHAEEFAMQAPNVSFIELNGKGHYESFLTADHTVQNEISVFLSGAFR